MRSLFAHISAGLTLILLSACQINFSEAGELIGENRPVCTQQAIAALNLTVLLPKKRWGCPNLYATAYRDHNGNEVSEPLTDLAPYYDHENDLCHYNFVGAFEWAGHIDFEVETGKRRLLRDDTFVDRDECHVIGQSFTYDMSDD